MKKPAPLTLEEEAEISTWPLALRAYLLERTSYGVSDGMTKRAAEREAYQFTKEIVDRAPSVSKAKRPRS